MINPPNLSKQLNIYKDSLIIALEIDKEAPPAWVKEMGRVSLSDAKNRKKWRDSTLLAIPTVDRLGTRR